MLTEEIEEFPNNKRRNFRRLGLILILFSIPTIYASNITLNNGNKFEFGQGVLTVTACNYSIAISATADGGDQINGNGAISTGDGTWLASAYVKDVDISYFDPLRCKGTTLTIQFYGNSGNSALPIFLHKLGYDFATCADPNNYLAGAPGSNACDGKPSNLYSGTETRWLSAWGQVLHVLNVTFDTDTALAYIGAWNGDDDYQSANLTNRKLLGFVVNQDNSSFNINSNGTTVSRFTNYNQFPYMNDSSTIGGQYPGRFGPYFPNSKSRYYKLVGQDYGPQALAASNAYDCPPYTSGGTNGQCSQVGELQFYTSSDKITLQISNAGAITVQNGIGTNIAFTNGCSNLTQATLTGGYGNFPTKAQALLVPEIGVCQNSSGTYKIRFAYPVLKIADVANVTVQTS